MSRPVATRKEKAQVATISAHNDERSASLSPKRWRRSAPKASSRSRKSKTTETTLDVVEGMQFDRGYLSPYFITDPEKMAAVLEDAFILLTRPKIGRSRI